MKKLNIGIVAMLIIAIFGIVNVASAAVAGPCVMDETINSPCNKGYVDNSYEHVKQVKDRIAPIFLRMPGVTGIGVTKINNEYAIMITLLNIKYSRYIPSEISDITIITKVTGPIRAL